MLNKIENVYIICQWIGTIEGMIKERIRRRTR